MWERVEREWGRMGWWGGGRGGEEGAGAGKGGGRGRGRGGRGGGRRDLPSQNIGILKNRSCPFCLTREPNIASETNTEMEDERTQPGSVKRPIDLADDLRKAIEDARRVLPDLSTSPKRATQIAQ